jgi:DUF1680 family protein
MNDRERADHETHGLHERKSGRRLPHSKIHWDFRKPETRAKRLGLRQAPWRFPNDFMKTFLNTLTLILTIELSSHSAEAQIQYLPFDERAAAGMGVERVAMYLTPAYESKPAQNNDEVRWVQLDLGGRKRIDAIKLLPKPVISGSFIHSEGFPSRFKIEISDDPEFKTAIVYDDESRTDFPDPYDAVVTFASKQVYGRYVRLTATRLRQKRLALTKVMVLSRSKDIAEGCPASDSESGNLGLTVLTNASRPQVEGVVTDNPGNVIPVDRWHPVAYKAQAPLGGVRLGNGVFKRAMEDNIRYLMSSFTLDELLRNFYLKTGMPVGPLAKRLDTFWMVDIPGSEAGRFLGGAGTTLRWMDEPALRERMNRIVDAIDACKEPDGYIMAYPKNKIFCGEYGAYTRSMVTHGLIEAGYVGNKTAFALLRHFYDWFDQSCYLPELLRRGGQGGQGMIPNTRMYFTPVGKPEDIQVVQRYFQENYWLKQLAARDPKAIWLYPYDRPHCYLITVIEPYLDLYRATGAKKYLDAACGGWDLFHDDWEHVGGSIAICEGTFLYPPKSYYLHKSTGELCGSVFWAFLNQRFHLLYPDQEKYVAEIEKSIYNVLLANQAGTNGFLYHASLDGRINKSRCRSESTCCETQGTRMVGSLPEFIYSVTTDGIYVDLFAPSTIHFSTKAGPMSLTMVTQFPYGKNVQLTVNVGSPVRSNIRIRVPSWASHAMPIFLNGAVIATGTPGTYVSLDRQWNDRDTIAFTLPMDFQVTRYIGLERDPKHERFALEYGPLLMAYMRANGREPNTDLTLPVGPDQLTGHLKPVPGSPLHFTVDDNRDCEYVPYFEIQDVTFTCYAQE